ncbi:hypothetical protein [Streptomyces antimicrobicus]|uniref:Uncharacterized protein n=1 Tax=Streptomyces antimicrobicus TaxID=2883108 RepID=A0ABS8B4W7_9ACTN|nr:hypothetical protein [Streptomyces antimicrobicus]MCB5179653.1 hypothetical protein [Streptomyces antimicrobicus]
MRGRNALALVAVLLGVTATPVASAVAAPAAAPARGVAVPAPALAPDPGQAAAAPGQAAVAVPVPPPLRDVGVGPGGGARPAPALPSRAKARCGGEAKDTAFPIGARIRGGPSVYRAGAPSQSWYLDLTNTTDAPCTAIHPVVVFTDQARILRPAHLRMDFEAGGGVTHPVTLERSDRDEIIAVFDGGSAFPGFAVGPGGSVTVKVHLAFAPDAPHGEVVADAALVQRRGDDGDWIGEAGGYRFSVEGPEEPVDGAAGSLARTGGSADMVRARAQGLGAVAVAALVAGASLVLGARRLHRR